MATYNQMIRNRMAAACGHSNWVWNACSPFLPTDADSNNKHGMLQGDGRDSESIRYLVEHLLDSIDVCGSLDLASEDGQG